MKISRRNFLTLLGLSSLILHTRIAEAASTTVDFKTFTGSTRLRKSRTIRNRSNARMQRMGTPKHRNNGEEKDYPYVANHSKYLPHDSLGDPIKSDYKEMLNALKSAKAADFEELRRPGVGKLKNPLAASAYNLVGLDSSQYYVPPSNRIDSEKNSAEAAELYWTSILRDINFEDYNSSTLVAEACQDLSRFNTLTYPKAGGVVTPGVLFRSNIRGINTGPYVSQFLLKDVAQGTQIFDQRQVTHMPDQEFLTNFNLWLAAQNGKVRRPPVDDPIKRYIRNARDLGEYVHIDRLSQAFNNAAYIINFRLDPGYDFQLGSTAPFDKGHPYLNSSSMQGFATFDYPHLIALVNEIMIPALKAVWYQKYYVHRRLRPEEFGARVHNMITGQRQYPIHSSLFNSTALDKVFTKYGTYLMPVPYFEGSPAHSAYPSGHATVAGACATILKAWFDEDYVFTEPFQPSSDGTSLVPYTGAPLTLGGELNKLAWNVGFGRTLATVHWRTDIEAGLKLGEKVAIAYLEAHKETYREKFSFTITKFDGTKVVIKN